jgi:hypothetical protein
MKALLGVCLLLIALVGCGNSTGTGTGFIEVAMFTEPAPPAGTQYTLTIDGPSGQQVWSISPNVDQPFGPMVVGSYTLTLSDVTAGCSVEGGNTRSTQVLDREVSTVEYRVNC